MIISPHVTAKISKGLSEIFLLIDKLIPWQSQAIQAPEFTTLLLYLIIFLQVHSWRELEEQVNGMEGVGIIWISKIFFTL